MRKKYVLILLLSILLIFLFCFIKKVSPIDSFNQFVATIANFLTHNRNTNTDEVTPILYFGNYLISLFIAFLINSIIIFTDSRIKISKMKDLKKSIKVDFSVKNSNAEYTRTTKEYHPRSD